MRVDFVIGGTQKGGTSALDSFLRQHPEICMPTTRKELHFFDREQENRDYKEYHRNFKLKKKQHRVIGEASPIYMYWETAPYRIWKYNPKMKWILALRNPVERAFSAWNMESKRDHEKLPFAEAIEKEAERCRMALPLQHRVYSYIDRGFYAHQVRRLFNIFGKANCLVLLNEELRNDHQQTLRRVFEFLGVDPSFVPPEASVFEQEYSNKIDNQLRSRLIEKFYFDIKELEKLLGKDLASWYAK
ncbi:MAG TPA: sulfotransferase domain-containing protein [Chthoniobacterales bacterium]|jgi:sulfotransferase family protein|nr:sulfotransferase domain-containing protein [Chthoniobacterales bacterium]